MRKRSHQFAAAGVLLACALSTGSAHGIQQPNNLPIGLELSDGSFARPLRTVAMQPPKQAAKAWRRFRAQAGGSWVATWDEATGVPSRIFGRGIAVPQSSSSAKIAQRFARDFLESHLDLLAPGSSIADFSPVTNELSGGMRVVAFEQYHAGLRVRGGQVSFRFKNNRMFVIGSEALPQVSIAQGGSLVPAAKALATATKWVEQDFGLVDGGAEVGDAFILPLLSPSGVMGYRVVREAKLRTSAPIGQWSVYVDAHTGAPVAREQTLLFATGNVMFNVPVRRPTDVRADYPARKADVKVDTAVAQTDDLGVLTFSGGPVTVDTFAKGARALVLNDTGGEATASFSLADGGTLVWDGSSSANVDSQLTSYVHTQIAKDHAVQLSPQLQSFVNQKLVVNVNINDNCNAFYDGQSINFFEQSQQCENTGRLADVVYHEFGHAFHHHSILQGSGEFDEALSEGVSDFYCASITGDPAMGRGFFYSAQPLRHIDPSLSEKVWPDDIAGDTHETGLIIAGALWDLRKLLITKHGDPQGADLTDQLFAEALKNAVDIPSMYTEILAADDDDGNIENGTPNACEIAEAFGAHGLRSINVAGSTIDVANPTLTGYQVSIKVEGLFQSCPDDMVGSATVNYKRREEGLGALKAIDMTGGPIEFSAEIPAVSDGTVVNYNVTVDLGAGTELTFPDNAADPLYEFFVGNVTPIYCTDFETDPEADGWTHGLLSGNQTEGADDWQWGTPAGTAANGDPPEAFSGTMIFGNDLGHGNFNGHYQPNKTNYADSPVIDVSAFENVRLQYRRWLQVEDGFFDRARIYVNGQVGWDNYASPSDQNGEGKTHHTDREWRFHDLDLSDKVSSDGTVQIRYEIESDGGLEMGGWSLDDFCIVAYEATDPAPECGNGQLELGEQCDDGNTADGDGCDANCLSEGDNGEQAGEPVPPLQVGGGCGCEVAGERSQAPWQLALLGLGFVGFALRRRKRQG